MDHTIVGGGGQFYFHFFTIVAVVGGSGGVFSLHSTSPRMKTASILAHTFACVDLIYHLLHFVVFFIKTFYENISRIQI